MKKNYSILNAVVGMMIALCMTFGFQSCGQVDNPLEEIINTVSEKTGATPEEVSALIQSALSDEAVQQAIASGEPIKITVSSSTSTSSSDQTITIPMNDGLSVELTFTNGASTSDDNPLEFKAETGADADSGDSANELTIAMPDITGLVITIELPTTTVTLTTNGTSTVYKSVTAKTATNTLIIDRGVTVKTLVLNGGSIVVNEGGEIETLCMIARTNECALSVGAWWASYGWGPPEVYGEGGMISNQDGNGYMPKNIRVEKGESSYIGVNIIGPDDQILENLTIGDDLTTAIEGGTRAKNIEGEGTTAKLNVRGYVPAEKDPGDPGYNENNHNFYYFFDKNTESVSNLTIVPEKNDEVLTTEELGDGNFVSFQMEFFGKANGITELTFENCNFKFDAPRVAFELYCFNPTEADFEDFKGVLILKNCTINGEPITNTNFNLFNTGNNPGASYQVKMITGETTKTYKVTAGSTELVLEDE